MARTRTRVRVRGNSDLGFGLGLLGLGLELGLGSGLEFGLEPGSGLELWLGYEQKSYCANTYASMAWLHANANEFCHRLQMHSCTCTGLASY